MTTSIKIWDLPTRIFHWSLAAAFFTAWLTEDHYKNLHQFAGYSIVALVLFRLAWGVIGNRHARFTQFVKGPRATFDYLRQMARGKAARHVGHNPAGAAMIVALLLLLTCTTLTGMALLATDGHGPFAATFIAHLREHTVEEIHEFFANATMFLVIFHVIGVLVSSLMHRENLIRAMITGRKRAEETALPATVTSKDP